MARVPTGVRLKVDPHDYNHGGFWPFGTNGRAGYVRAAPLLDAAPCLGYWWECLQGARVLGLSACGPRQPLDGVDPIWNTSALKAHRLRRSLPPRPAGVRGALRRDPPGLVSGSGDHHGSLASVGVTWHAETKNPPRGGHFGSLGAETPWTSGNRFGGTVLPKHLPSLRHEGAGIKQNSLRSLLPMATAIGDSSCLHGLDSRDVAMQAL